MIKYSKKGSIYLYEKIGTNSAGLFVLSFEYNHPDNPKYSSCLVEPATFEAEFKEYKEPRKGTFWLNIGPDGVVVYKWSSRALADAAVSVRSRIACIEVPWVEGQGLDKCACLNKQRCEC